MRYVTTNLQLAFGNNLLELQLGSTALKIRQELVFGPLLVSYVSLTQTRQ